jgi:electron transfer flavoprotein beta subunit
VNIAVCIKQVPDTETKVKVTADKKWIKEEEINFILNPYDEFAVEEALKIKEANGGDVTIISLGPDRVATSIRSALAMGADKAIHIKAERNPTDPMVIAQVLSQVLSAGNFDLILLGKQAIDDDNQQIGPILSEKLNMPSANVVTKLEVTANSVVAERQIEGGFEKINCTLPAIITAQRGLNEPRYASLKGIMAAKKIPITEVEVDIPDDKIEILQIDYPPEKSPGKIVGEGADAVPELIRLLREEAKVIS